MNREDIRKAVWAQLDWSPAQATTAVDRANEFINRAYFRMAMEAPYLFFQDKVHFASQPDLVNADADDTCRVHASDRWVLQKTLASATTPQTNWNTDPTHWGRWIEVTESDGTVHRHQIREIWTADSDQTGTKDHISLMTPWHNVTDTGMTWRIFTPQYSVPGDVLQIHSARLYKNNQDWPLAVVDQGEAEEWSLADTPSTNVAGVPRLMFRRKIEAPVPAPSTAPTAATAVAAGTWDASLATAQPVGQFSYRVTYYWAERDDEWQNPGWDAVNMVREEPRWESSPSTASSTVTVTHNGNAVRVTSPDLHYMQGFGGSATARYHHAGWRKRIWRRRHVLDTTSAGNPRVEADETYYLIADINGHATTWDDDGTVTPDYHRRLRDDHGVYETLFLSPRPDARYEVDLRVIRRPTKLTNDADAPRLRPEAVDILIDAVLMRMYETQGDKTGSAMAKVRYDEGLFLMAKRYGDLRPASTPVSKHAARATPSRFRKGGWRRWYTLPS